MNSGKTGEDIRQHTSTLDPWSIRIKTNMKKIFSAYSPVSFQANAQVDPARHVDPFIGTGAMVIPIPVRPCLSEWCS